MKTFQMLIIALLLLNLVGCNQEEAAANAAPSSTAHAKPDSYFPLTLGNEKIRVQLAILPSEQAEGLMYRQKLAENDGMLFIFPSAGQRSFWMKNVDIPLDVGYIRTDGVLREVYPMYPHVEKGVKSDSDEIQYVLEMNQGWYKNHKVYPGVQLDFAEIASAMQARGFDPANYGVPTQ
ncbi:DUF192 domain-containing protein [Cerasicoccus frondis]|uniref:DUF192 domain-containing protein n=1 Tax=Cerasicoccus frondis TaxID=490090 RepID=UPI0028526C33|nr:DUF192 domain-containing protein [Cerasicoccus frondis]